MIDFIQNNWVNITGVVIGFIFLYLEYKANIWMWAASIAMAGFYIYIFYDTQLYASMVIYIYFFIASLYGWLMWIKKGTDRETGNGIITQMQRKYTVYVVTSVIIVFGIIYLILIRYSSNQSYIAVGDALTTSLNIVALWMISRKWAEQWLLVIPANAISSLLLFAQNDSMSGILFLVFFVVSIFGYFKWKRLAIAVAEKN